MSASYLDEDFESLERFNEKTNADEIEVSLGDSIAKIIEYLINLSNLAQYLAQKCLSDFIF